MIPSTLVIVASILGAALIGIGIGVEIAPSDTPMTLVQANLCPALKQCRGDIEHILQERDRVVILHAQLELQRALAESASVSAGQCAVPVQAASLAITLDKKETP